MPQLGRNAIRVVRQDLKRIFWGYVGGRLHNSTDGFIKFDEFASWVRTLRPDADYIFDEALTLDVFSEWLSEFVHHRNNGFKGELPV